MITLTTLAIQYIPLTVEHSTVTATATHHISKPRFYMTIHLTRGKGTQARNRNSTTRSTIQNHFHTIVSDKKRLIWHKFDNTTQEPLPNAVPKCDSFHVRARLTSFWMASSSAFLQAYSINEPPVRPERLRMNALAVLGPIPNASNLDGIKTQKFT
jgi:hypothetical protein